MSIAVLVDYVIRWTEGYTAISLAMGYNGLNPTANCYVVSAR